MQVKRGDKVIAEAVGTLEDGTVFESPEFHDEPVEYDTGSDTLIKGFVDALIGMEVGDEKEVTVSVEDGYGEPNPELIKEIPRGELPEDDRIQEGAMLLISLPNGLKMPINISALTEDTATIDLNHPLAGKVLHFKIKLVKIVDSEDEKEEGEEEK